MNVPIAASGAARIIDYDPSRFTEDSDSDSGYVADACQRLPNKAKLKAASSISDTRFQRHTGSSTTSTSSAAAGASLASAQEAIIPLRAGSDPMVGSSAEGTREDPFSQRIKQLESACQRKDRLLCSKEEVIYKLRLDLLQAKMAVSKEKRLESEEVRRLKMELDGMERERDFYVEGTDILRAHLAESQKISTYLTRCLSSVLIDQCYPGFTMEELFKPEHDLDYVVPESGVETTQPEQAVAQIA
ncbi:hypothetical protein BKA70DRAFT_1220262 [Coprinopsis sp. MPI-PUGE-AT-0042]|nr:hypothetical protein BKA70DRAFT_1220262 [Coprinopsis sp. MPI-PUGE-AT-0042]